MNVMISKYVLAQRRRRWANIRSSFRVCWTIERAAQIWLIITAE